MLRSPLRKFFRNDMQQSKEAAHVFINSYLYRKNWISSAESHSLIEGANLFCNSRIGGQGTEAWQGIVDTRGCSQ